MPKRQERENKKTKGKRQKKVPEQVENNVPELSSNLSKIILTLNLTIPKYNASNTIKGERGKWII